MDSILEQQACNLNTPPEKLRALAEQSKKLARLVCTNPNAEPDLLRKLANKSDDKILSAVASNPNTPTEVLWKLGAEFPERVLSNPVFPLLLIENPNLVEIIPKKTIESFLKVADIKSNAVLTTLAASPKTPASILTKLAKINNNAIHMSVAGNPSTPKEVLLELKAYDSKIFSHQSIKNHTKQLLKAVNPQIRSDKIAIEAGAVTCKQSQNLRDASFLSMTILEMLRSSA